MGGYSAGTLPSFQSSFNSDVRYWPKADMGYRTANVRFWGVKRTLFGRTLIEFWPIQTRQKGATLLNRVWPLSANPTQYSAALPRGDRDEAAHWIAKLKTFAPNSSFLSRVSDAR